MALLAIEKFGGIIPRIADPRIIPEGKAQVAVNCRFDRGGVLPFLVNLFNSTPTKTGTKLTIFLYQSLYWFCWITDVDAVLSPTPIDSFKRVYFTESGVFKVTDYTISLTGGTLYPENAYLPCPPAPAILLTASLAGTPTDPDLTNQETRYYVYTFVNAYGDEGPPSLPSNKIVWSPGQTVSLITASDPTPAGAYNLATARIYRTNMDASGNEQYQFVMEITIAGLTTSHSDAVASAALGEILQTTLWESPPSGLTGLISLPNAALAAYTGNTVCFSVPGFPHAWPLTYQKNTDRPIMGLGAWGSTTLVLTQGAHYLCTGSDPASSVMDKMEQPVPGCVSKRSVVDCGLFVMFASTDGLTAIGSGVAKTLTETLFTPEGWRATFTPATINAYFWAGKYVGFYTTGGTSAGFIFDPHTLDFVNLDFYATAGYFDPMTGTLFLQVGADIVAFNSGATNLTFNNISKRHALKPSRFNVIKVLAPAYPVTVDVIYPGQTVTVSVTSSAPQRITPTPGMVDAADVRVYGTKGATVVYLATTMGELPL